MGTSRAVRPATSRMNRSTRQTKVPGGNDTINDSPQKIGETQEEYRNRLRKAVADMDIEHRVRPLGPPKANFNEDQQAYQRAF